MIPRLAPPLLVVLLCALREVHGTKQAHDVMDSFLHGMDSKQSVSVVAPHESVRQPQKLQANHENAVELKVTTEVYQTHIPFGTRLRPLSTPKPYTASYGTDAPPLRPLKRPSSRTEQPTPPPTTSSPARFLASPPLPDLRQAIPRTLSRADFDEPILLTDSPRKGKRRRLKQTGPLQLKPHKPTPHSKAKASDFTDFKGLSPITEGPIPQWVAPPSQPPFGGAPYEPGPPPQPPPPGPRAPSRQRKSDFGTAINEGTLEVPIAPRQPHLPSQPNRFHPVAAARLTSARPGFTTRREGADEPSRRARKKEGNFDSILDFIDKQDKLNTPKTSGRKRGGSFGKTFSPKEGSLTAFKPNGQHRTTGGNSHKGKNHSANSNNNNNNNNDHTANQNSPKREANNKNVRPSHIDGSANKDNNKTAPNFNKRIAFLQDRPFQGSPQAFFFFTNVGPNHIEYRGVFNPSAVPLNFKDSPDALFQLIPHLPKLFNFDNRGIPPPQEPPKPRQPLPPRLPLPTPPVIEDPLPLTPIALPPPAPLSLDTPHLVPLNPAPISPAPPVPATEIPQRPPALIQADPPRPVYPLAVPPPPNLQLADRPINLPFPKYDFVRGSFDGYPKIFRFNDERISILDFDKQKKAGQVIRRKGDDLDPERVPRNSFLIFHGGQFPSKEDTLSRNRLDYGLKNNRLRNFVDFGNFLE